MISKGKMTNLLYELTKYLARAMKAVDDNELEAARGLVDDIAHIAATTDTEEQNDGYTDLGKK